jgi:hypothetical protein
VRVRLPSGLILEDVTIHCGDEGCWAGMPSKPMLDAGGQLVRDASGKVRYVNLINFSTRARRQAMSRLHAKYPAVFD